MKPEENSKQQNQGELFRNRLDQILDPRHPLYQIANKIDWEKFEERIRKILHRENRSTRITNPFVSGTSLLETRV
ncbi:hypothetical protein LEP1GSC026_1261 [Leptospira interrogans str. 2002000623]|nr:hypothetical protein LEP1GSC026_1261 [Leptospira interrogans str. 2002000623]